VHICGTSDLCEVHCGIMFDRPAAMHRVNVRWGSIAWTYHARPPNSPSCLMYRALGGSWPSPRRICRPDSPLCVWSSWWRAAKCYWRSYFQAEPVMTRIVRPGSWWQRISRWPYPARPRVELQAGPGGGNAGEGSDAGLPGTWHNWS